MTDREKVWDHEGSRADQRPDHEPPFLEYFDWPCDICGRPLKDHALGFNVHPPKAADA